MANKKITDLTSAASINGSEYSEIVQSGTNKKVLKSTERTYFQENLGSAAFASTSAFLASTSTTDNVPEGATNFYYTSTRFNSSFSSKSTSDLSEGSNLYFTETRVRSTPLTGLSVTGITISSTDTVLQAFGKLQNQINGISSASWTLASGGTLTGANTVTGNTTNTLKYVFNSLGVTQTNGAGAWFSNTTAATSGNQQVSPSIVLEGQGFETTGSTSQSVKWANYVLPVQGTTSSGTWTLAQSNNGAAYTNVLTITSTGVTTLTTGAVGTGFTVRTGGSIYFRANDSGSVFLGNTSSPRIGSSTSATSTFAIAGSSLTYQSDVSHYFTTQSVTNLTLGSATLYSFASAGFSGTSGSNTGTIYSFTPTINVTAGSITVRGLVYDPTLTSVSGITNHYGLIIAPSGVNNGFGTTSPTAVVDVAASTTSRASIRIRTGSAPSSPNDGDIWQDGTDVKIRIGGVTKTFTIL